MAKRLGIKIGVAGETSNPNSNGLKRSYFVFQPYLDVKIDAAKNLVFKLKYRSGSTYPDISQTNPYSNFVDLQSVRTGNPNLRPAVLNKISLQTTILNGLLTIEPYYHFSNNYITEVGIFRPDSIFEYSTNNAGIYRNYGVELSLTIPFGKNIFLQSNTDVYFSRIKYLDKTNKVNDWATSTQLIYQNLKSKTMLGVQYQKANNKFITAQGFSTGNNDYWLLFVRQPFFKERLSVQFVYITPISFGVNYKQEHYIKTDYYTEDSYNDITLLKNIMILELSYRFNKGKSVNRKEKEIEKINEKSGKGLF
jgi:outer membrane receptor protein involved in Fe transport